MRYEFRRRVFAGLYGPGARVYDRFTRWLFLGEWERWQDTALGELPDSGLIVELGSGTGALAARRATSTRVWVGVEPSAAMVRVARTRRGARGPWFVRANARALPIKADVADAIVATFPTDYILDHGVAREACRVLKPGGRVVVVLTGALASDEFGRRVRRRALSFFYGRGKQDETGMPSFKLVGFEGTTRRLATKHGEAVLYVGRPLN